MHESEKMSGLKTDQLGLDLTVYLLVSPSLTVEFLVPMAPMYIDLLLLSKRVDDLLPTPCVAYLHKDLDIKQLLVVMPFVLWTCHS